MEKIDIAKYSEQSYLDYAIAVLKDRAIPYLQDGQKPVHRRILYVMNELGLKDGNQAKKSARIVGDIIGKYHPHGDSAVYEAMVRMSQDFSLRYPLVNGQGNFGSRDGDSPAAMRYTEAKLTPISELLLSDLKYNCVNYIDNYDNTMSEPELLPSRLNFLLMNGTSGIAIGARTDIPSHNINDVTKATIAYIDNKDITSKELATILGAPDLATGGQIITPKSEITEAYENGLGSLTVRCRWEVEKQTRGQYRIVINELPPKTSVEKVLQNLDSIVNPLNVKGKNGKNKKINDMALKNKAFIQSLISDAYNDSDHNLRLIIEPKSSKIDPEDLMSKIYKMAGLEESLKIDLTTVGNDMLPKRKNIKDIISEWFDFRFLTVTKRIESLLKKAEDRIHILNGRTIAFNNIDKVINIIKESEEPESELISTFNLSEIQAKDILEIKLRQLAKLEIDKINKELSALNKDKDRYESLLNSKIKMENFIKKEIIQDTERFSDERRTLIEEAEKSTTRKEDTVIEEKVTIVINDTGWLTQRKGHDIDLDTIHLRDNSKILKHIELMSNESIYALNSEGRIFNIRAFDIPSGKNFIHVNSLIENNGQIIHYDKIKNEPIFFGSSSGYGFISSGESLTTKNKSGKQFIDIAGTDAFTPTYIEDFKSISCLSNENRLLNFELSEIKYLKNGGKGVQLIKMDNNTLLKEIQFHKEGELSGKINKKKFNIEDYKLKRARKGKLI